MKLINTDGMAFIGPGSEWFWTAVSGVVLAVTFLAIFRQLRAQAGANALARIDSLPRRYEGRELVLAKLQVAIELRSNDRPMEMSSRMDPIAGFFDTLYELHKAGFMSLREIDERFGGGVQIGGDCFDLRLRVRAPSKANRACTKDSRNSMRFVEDALQDEAHHGPTSLKLPWLSFLTR